MSRYKESLNKYLIEIIVFVCGASGMVLELVGSRILSPFFGNSLIVWTSLIGVMLGFMSLGYFLGGKLADKKLNYSILFQIIIMASFFIGIIFLIDKALLPSLASVGYQGLFAVIASIFLFAFPSTLLGMVSPYSIRLKMKDLRNSGQTIGSLYAISTVGSIVGTFLSGFILIAYMGSHNILIVLSIILLLLSLLIIGRLNIKKLSLVLLIILLNLVFFILGRNSGVISIDTQYDRYFIKKTTDVLTSRPVVFLSRDNKSVESAVYADNGDPYILDYYSYYDLVDSLVPENKRSLMLGGGAFSYPRHYIDQHPNSVMDIVEIDPQLFQLSKSYFLYQENPNLKIQIEDGRTFLNGSKNKYNVVYLDAFKSYASVPYQLATKESMERCYDMLDDNGVLVMNTISSIKGSRGKFLSAEYKTLKSVFPQVIALASRNKKDDKGKQNIILVASKRRETDIKTIISEKSHNLYSKIILDYQPMNDVAVLTDDFAPTDQYLIGI